MDCSITKNMFFNRKKTMIGVLSPLPKESTYQTRYLDSVPSLKIDLVIAKNYALIAGCRLSF